MNRDINVVCNFLKTKSIQIPTDNEWITSCVECFKQQGNVATSELCELVYQQWLLADLSDIGVQVIPHNLFNSEKHTLVGKYAVQVNYLVNVAVSFHKQLQKIRRPDILKNLVVDSEAQGEPRKKEESSNRMLKIEFTDGVVTFVGFEDQFVPSLKEPFVPGMKAVLVGPIECRKGVLFLKSNNIMLLGGEVESLHIPNATENVLARALKVPENPDPYFQHITSQYTNSTQYDTHSVNSSYSSQIGRSNLNSTTSGTSCVIINDDELDADEDAMMMLADFIENSGSVVNSSNSIARNTVNAPSKSSINSLSTNHPSTSVNNTLSSYHTSNAGWPTNQQDLKTDLNFRSKPQKQDVFSVSKTSDIDFDDDFELLAAQTTATVEISQSNSSSRCIDSVAAELQTYEMFDSRNSKKDFEEIEDIKKKLLGSYGGESSHQNSSSKSSLQYREDGKIVVDCLDDKVSPLIALPIDPELEDLPNSTQGSESRLFSIEPFPPRKRPATVTTRARVVKIKKPKIVNEKWSVSAHVEAKSILVEVRFESEVIDQIFELSAAEINSKRYELSADPVKKAEINKLLKIAHSRLSSLDCDMTFSFKDAISDPVITRVFIDR